MTVEQSAQTAGDHDPGGDSATTASVLTSVERQLTRYFAVITRRVDESLAAIEAQRVATEAYQQALQRALDERLAEVTAHHAARVHDLDVRLTQLAAQPAGVAPEDLLQIRQSMREDIWKSIAPVTERLDAVADANRRTDEQAAALVEHVNTTTATLIARIEDGDQRVAQAATRAATESADALSSMLAETQESLTNRIESVEGAAAALTAATEARFGELADATAARHADLADATTARDAELDAKIDDLRSSTSQSTEALRTGLETLERRVGTIGLDVATLQTKVAGIDQDAIEDLKGKMSAAVGEAMLVRIELDRVQTTTDEKLDKTAMRLGEIEALMTDEMDVSTAVQLERLDELERALAMLDPGQFVRKDEVLTGSGVGTVNPDGGSADTSHDGNALHDDSGHHEFGDMTHDSAHDDSAFSDGMGSELSSSETWS